MQKKLYKLLLFMSLQGLIVGMFQVLTMQLLIAADINGQSLKDTRVTLDLHNYKLTDIFKTIEDKTDYDFAYPNEVRKSKARFSLKFENETLENVLLKLCKDGKLKFKVVQYTITAAFDENLQKPKPEVIVEARVDAEISGRVTDETGNPLPGVNVLVKGTTQGTTTDADGKFVLSVPDRAVLVFSFIGYTPQEVAVGDQTIFDVSMKADITQLGEVLVIGYGEKKRANLTGAVASVGSEVMESRPITNTVSALQGVVPGLIIQRGSGQPGDEGFNINVRGISSKNGNNNPLLIVDGIAVENLNLINPSDIETISVLKDAQAAIYGARAAGGVILITTKTGKKGAPRITYSTNFAISKLAGMMETPNHYQFAIMDNEANIHNGAAPMYTPELLEKVRVGDPNPIPHPVYGGSGWMLFFPSTDWRSAVFENGFQHKHTLSFSGGGENSTYYLSGSYANQKGVIKYGDDNNKRYNLRLNYDYNIKKWLRLESKLALENQVRSDVGGSGGSAGVMYETIFGMPNHPIYTQSGEKYFAQGGWGNAVAQAKYAGTSTFDTRNINTNFKLIVDVHKDLKLNFQSGINYRTNKNTLIAQSHPLYKWDESAIAYYSVANPEFDWVNEIREDNIYRNFTGYLTYGKLLGSLHQIDFMAGASHEENDYDKIGAERYGFVADGVWALNAGGTDYINNLGTGSVWAIRSLFSRLSYAFNDKYLFEANLRYDGSSRFKSGSRWGLFPAVSVGWRLSEENFIQNLSLFDNLKLRASYGETGNNELENPALGRNNLFNHLQLINIRSDTYPFGPGTQTQSAYLDGMVSLNRSWETIATTNVGLDATLLSNKLDFSFDYFVKKNKDMVVPVVYPSMLGAVPPETNNGSMKTWGFETSLTWKDRVGALQYGVKLILSDAQNEMTDVGGQDTYVLGLNGPQSPEWWNSQSIQPREGYPLNSYFAYQFEGVIRTQEELDAYKLLGGVPSDIGIGDAKFKDVNGDGKISLYGDEPGQDGDVIYAGNTFPRYTYGMNIDLKWKGFDIGIFLQGVGKRTLFRYGEYSMPWSDWWRQPPLFYYGKTWNEDRPDAEYPKLTHGNIRYWNYQPSTLQAVNAAYLRLKNIQIGYSLPEALLSKISISRVRIYFSGFDLWETHKVKGGWDPESNITGFNYPFQRMYSFGIDATF